jgi:hypothetical protein
VVVLGVSPTRSLRRRINRVLFITQNAALLASPTVTLQHGTSRASRVKRHAKHLAPLSKRGDERLIGRRSPSQRAPFPPRPMISPAVVPVAIGAAILALVLPGVLCDVLHAEATATFRVLAYMRGREPRLCTCVGTVNLALSELARRCLNLLTASRIAAWHQDAAPLPQVHARIRAEMLHLSERGKTFSARSALMVMDWMPQANTFPLRFRPKRRTAFRATLRVSSANAAPRNRGTAIAACE